LVIVTAPRQPCAECGEPLGQEDAFCGGCGAKVADPSLPALPFAAPRPVSSPPVTPPPPSFASPSPPTSESFAPKFAAVGEVSQNSTYVGNRLLFTRNQDVELSFVTLITIGMIWTQVKILLFLEFVAWLVSFVLVLISWLIAGRGAASFMIFVAFALYLFVLIAWLRSGTQEPISEWELLIDGKSTSADDAYAAIALSLSQRAVPADVRPQRIVSDVKSGQVRNYLTVRRDNFAIYVSVIPYGTGLYVAWSMWRELTTAQTVADWFRQRRNRSSGAGGLLNMMLRAEPVRAMREVVHNAVREGVEVALAGTRVDLAAAFGGNPPRVGHAATPTAPPSNLPPRPNFPPPPPAPGASGSAPHQ